MENLLFDMEIFDKTNIVNKNKGRPYDFAVLYLL
jgi:hypothetical protein